MHSFNQWQVEKVSTSSAMLVRVNCSRWGFPLTLGGASLLITTNQRPELSVNLPMIDGGDLQSMCTSFGFKIDKKLDAKVN